MAMLPMAAGADEVNDTTYQYKERQIVVEDDTMGVRISVYDRQGNRLTKTREASFIDGQEVERIFVGSPFIPKTELQQMDFLPHFPTVSFGTAHLTQRAVGNSYDAIHGRLSKGFDIGVTTFAFAQPLNKSNSFGLAAAVQMGYTRYCFQKDWLLQDGSPLSFVQTAERAKGDYMDVVRLKIPVVLQISIDAFDGIGFGLSPEWRLANTYKWNPQPASSLSKTAEGRSINTFGLNLVWMAGYGPFSMQAEMSLTPLFKTTDGHKAYGTSATIGIDVWTLMKMLKKR